MAAPLLLLFMPSHAAQPPGAPLDQLDEVAALTASVQSLLASAEAAAPDAADVVARYEAVLDSHAGDTPLAGASSAECYDDALRALEDGTHWLLQEDESGPTATVRLPDGAQPQAEAALEAAEARERALLDELRRERLRRKRAEARAGAAARAGGRAARGAVRTSTSKGAKRSKSTRRR